jgi:hypothetical protein
MQMRDSAKVTWRSSARTLTLVAIGVACLTSAVEAQSDRRALIQIEVSDSIGLPLPDATVEVFTFLDGGVFWEWARVGASDLPAGINLLRFAHPGYRPAVFSVPLREGGTVSLRVRLGAERDTTRRNAEVVAADVRAIGLSLEGRVKTDIIGRRHVLDRRALEGQTVTTFGGLLRRARGTELNVMPVSGGAFRPYAQSVSGGRCPVTVMVNGDRRRLIAFDAFDRLFSTNEVETIEVFPRGSSLPAAYQVADARCGILVVWFRVP